MPDATENKIVKNSAPSPAPAEMRRIGLRYVADTIPGISRLRKGKLFSYADQKGRVVRSEEILNRIKGLVIPPAWTDVWICPFADGHLQATGRDARGRKQYKYHSDFRQHRDSNKFSQITEFALALPRIRRCITLDLNKTGLPREKVVAAVIRLLERTLIRVGNQEYAEHNHSFGLSTLQNKHVKHCGEGIRFTFIGKSGVQHDVEVADPKLAKIVFRCHDLPGQHLFEYRDANGKVHSITSSDVNDYIHQSAKEQFSAKNFRTWKGSVLAALAFERLERPKNGVVAKSLVAKVVKDVATELRNTPATCRKYYIHPRLIQQFQDGGFKKAFKYVRSLVQRSPMTGLSHDEQAVLLLLKGY